MEPKWEELLIRLDERVKNIETGFNNHLKSHAKLSWLMLSVALSSIAALITSLLI